MDYKKLMDMTGKVCIVTGGTGYLGTENVKILKDFGATVVVADIRAAEERWANAPAAGWRSVRGVRCVGFGIDPRLLPESL